MNKISIIIISIIVIVGIGISIALYYTPSDDVSDIVGTNNTPADTTVPAEDTENKEDIAEEEKTTPPEEKVVVPKTPDVPEEPKVVTPQEPKEYIVEIYSFTDWRPASIILFVGDTITFINLDDELHWPGSDPHPTHSSLPLFDALGGISKGQSYSHTFTIPGVYGHHDHLLDEPPQLGFITVLPRE